jgi:hypothetical protein
MRASPPADPAVAAALLAAQQQAWTSQARPAAAPRCRRGGGAQGRLRQIGVGQVTILFPVAHPPCIAQHVLHCISLAAPCADVWLAQ